MTSGFLLLTLVAVHLMALVLMAGTTLIDFVTIRGFWKLSNSAQQEKALGLLEATTSFSRLTGTGAAFLIITGLLMMAVTKVVLGEQLWFRIKIALVIILLVNGLFVGRRQGQRLRKAVFQKGQVLSGQIAGVRKNLQRFYLGQFLIFILIIFLSISKFN
jgi:uncharacterized membrane protein SirB2